MKIHAEMPYNKYMTFNDPEWEKFSGKLSASQQPGYFTGSYEKDQQLLNEITEGEDPQNIDIDEQLVIALDEIYESGVRVIVSLADAESCRNPKLLKILWEQKNDAYYITAIDNVTTKINDHSAPSQKQLEIISGFVINQIEQGANVLVHCGAGFGRTGTILAAIYMVSQQQYDPVECINYIRNMYDETAIEKGSQIQSIINFSTTAQQMEVKKILASDDLDISIEDKNKALVITMNLNMQNEGIALLERGAEKQVALAKATFAGKENMRVWETEISTTKRGK